MSYNYPFPANYQSADYQPYQYTQRRVFASVQGEAAADVFPVNAGQDVILYDEDNPFVYSKSRDNNNRLTKKRFRLIEDEPQETQINLNEFVHKDEISRIIEESVRAEVDRRVSEMSITTKSRRSQKGEDKDE